MPTTPEGPLTLFCDGTALQVRVVRKQIRNVYLRLGADRGLVASAPVGYPRDRLLDFCQRHARRFARVVADLDRYERLQYDRGFLHLDDRRCDIRHVRSNGPARAQLLNGTLYVFTRTLSRTAGLAAVKAFMAERAALAIKPVLARRAAQMGLSFKTMRIGWATAQWGRCAPARGELFFAAQLAGYGAAVIDYVVVHELCHLLHPDHSPAFWREVARHCPQHRALREVLAHRTF